MISIIALTVSIILFFLISMADKCALSEFLLKTILMVLSLTNILYIGYQMKLN